ncbi:uncharacterized protein LOC143275103 isoform X2 [Babylonia areolata]|uniref:uncharacterized protein LOC143275103 isoform X2 n=1 Tax=Babylonia areolata TaxID=304850 RepID=UPI003FD5FAC8
MTVLNTYTAAFSFFLLLLIVEIFRFSTVRAFVKAFFFFFFFFFFFSPLYVVCRVLCTCVSVCQVVSTGIFMMPQTGPGFFVQSLKQGMDFSKFRASGDLSDIVVTVEGHENHLHRFPLYAKSDYFCGLARGPGLTQSPPSTSTSRVELSEFPGGQAVFSVVADFCYNMAPKVTKDNVVELRCAAQYLLMSGPGNLSEAADRYLQDILTSAKLSRSSSPLATLLLHCAGVGQLAADCGVVDTCTDALIDTLLRSPTKFSPTTTTTTTTTTHTGGGGGAGAAPGSAFTLQGSAFTPTKPSQALGSSALNASSSLDEDRTLRQLLHLPEEWFTNLLKKALDRGVVQSLLADMAVHYVSEAINRDAGSGGGGGINGHSTPVSDATATSGGGGGDGRGGGREDVEDLDKDVDSLGEELREVAGIAGGKEEELPFVPKGAGVGVVEDLGQLLDRVLTALPEEAYNMPALTLDWLTKVLRIATARGCACRQFLVKIAADMLMRLPAEELCLVSPSILHDIVLEAKADDSQAQRACLLVDTYLAEMAKKGVLTTETFRLLASATPADVRRNHDNLYEVLEYVLKSEKESLSTEQRKEILSTINLDLVSEDTLQRALDSDLVSAEPVARAALKLCGTLRSELESVKYIAQMQEEELQKYQARAAVSPQSSPRVPAFAALKMDSDSDSNQDTKTSPDSASEHVRAAQTVLSTARSKLAMPLYTGHRPYLPSSSHSHSSTFPSSSGTLEHDISLQDELEFRMDRSSFRSLEPRVRATRHFPGLGGHTSGSSSSHHHHHRSTYFPYTPRY